MRWLVTAHRDFARLDVAQFEIQADNREEAIALAEQQLAGGTVPWIEGELVKHGEGFIITPEGEP